MRTERYEPTIDVKRLTAEATPTDDIAEAMELLQVYFGKTGVASNRFIFLGSGHARVVFYDTVKKQAMKLARAYPGACQNQTEFGTYCRLKPTCPKTAAIVAPPTTLTCDDGILYLRAAYPLSMLDVVIGVPACFSDYQKHNVGWLPVGENIEKLVILDYADLWFVEKPYECKVTHIRQDDPHELQTLASDCRFYVVGDCRLVDTKEICTEKGMVITVSRGRLLTEYLGVNPHLKVKADATFMEGISTAAVKRRRAQVLEEREEAKRKMNEMVNYAFVDI